MGEDRMITLTATVPDKPILEVLLSVRRGEIINGVKNAISDAELRREHPGKYITSCEHSGLIATTDKCWYMTVLGRLMADALDESDCLIIPNDCLPHTFKANFERVTVHKCPVCEGRGQLGEDLGYKTCHGCQGRGWVKA